MLLNIFNILGMDTITRKVQPLLKFLRDEMKKTSPDENGYFIERFNAERQKNDLQKNTEGTFYGKRGESNTLGTLMDLFIAGNTVFKGIYISSQLII